MAQLESPREKQPLSRRRVGLALKISLLTIFLVAFSIIVTGALTYREDRYELKQEIGERLLGIVRTASVKIDGDRHHEIFRDDDFGEDSLGVVEGREVRLFGLATFKEYRDYLRQVQRLNHLSTDIYTFRRVPLNEDNGPQNGYTMEFVVMTAREPYLGNRLLHLSGEQRRCINHAFTVKEATATDLYTDPEGTWISAMAPILMGEGTVEGIVEVDYRVSTYLTLLARRREKIVLYSLTGMLLAFGLTVGFVRYLTGPVKVLTRAMYKVAEGDLNQEVTVRSRDEIGFLSESFNVMLAGLRQRDFLKYTLQRYVATSVVEHILQNPHLVNLHGEKRELTVYFSDIAGFTSLAETRPAEEIVELLNEYLGHLTDILFDHEGTLDKYEGDAIMAFWGAPLHQEDHAVRACRAALEVQARLRELRHEWRAVGKPRLPTRIGLNTGPMVVGNIGSDLHMDYTVIGDPVNLGARLESANKVYGTQIMMSEYTYQQAREHVEVRELDRILVQGKDQPVTVYELLAEKGALSSQQQQIVQYFHEGLALFRDRKWDEAARLFHQCLALDEDDLPSWLYVSRCVEMVKSPPPEDWEAVHRLGSK